MLATFSFNKETKTLMGKAGHVEWKVAIADEVYIIRGKACSMSEEALMSLDGSTRAVNFPDGFAEEIASGGMYPISYSSNIEQSSEVKIEFLPVRTEVL